MDKSIVCGYFGPPCRGPWPSPQYDHVSPLPQELHWLSDPECIKYRLQAALVFHCRHDQGFIQELTW